MGVYFRDPLQGLGLGANRFGVLGFRVYGASWSSFPRAFGPGCSPVIISSGLKLGHALHIRVLVYGFSWQDVQPST